MSYIDDMLLDQAQRLVGFMDEAAEGVLPGEIAEIVKFHAKGAAAAALAAAWVPGAGGTAALVAATGFVWAMYERIGKKVGLPFSKNLLQSVASGVATNMAANVVATFAATTIISLVPGLGSVASALIAGAMVYALTLASGYVYLKVITKLFAERVDLTTITGEELKAMVIAESKDRRIKSLIKEARSDFKTMRNRGDFKPGPSGPDSKWVEALRTVANVKADPTGDPTLARTLGDGIEDSDMQTRERSDTAAE